MGKKEEERLLNKEVQGYIFSLDLLWCCRVRLTDTQVRILSNLDVLPLLTVGEMVFLHWVSTGAAATAELCPVSNYLHSPKTLLSGLCSLWDEVGVGLTLIKDC